MGEQLDLFGAPKKEPSTKEWEEVFKSEKRKEQKKGPFNVVSPVPRSTGSVGRTISIGIGSATDREIKKTAERSMPPTLTNRELGSFSGNSSNVPIPKGVESERVPKDEVWLADKTGVIGKAVNVGTGKPAKEYGDEYLAKGIARWSVYCFLWLSKNGKVCAPYFGDSHDKSWKPSWIDLKQAQEMLQAAHYTNTSLHRSKMPGTTRPAVAMTYRLPDDSVRYRLKREAKKKNVDGDLWLFPHTNGMDGDEADEFYQLLRAIRRGAETDDSYRMGLK